eukprot:gene5946-7405_t
MVYNKATPIKSMNIFISCEFKGEEFEIENSNCNNFDVGSIEVFEGYKLSTLSSRRDTQVIRIEGRCGMLLFEGLPGVDVFQSHRHAISFLQKKYTFKSKLRVFAILGYIIGEKSSHLLVATKIRNEGELLGCHSVNTVMEYSWIRIELSYLSSYQSNKSQQTDGAWTTNCDFISSSYDSGGSFTPPNSTTTNNTSSSTTKNETSQSILKNLQSFPLEATHYYCELYDLTNYFPSCLNTPYQYCQEFCWNEWLRKPFENSSLSHLCVVLLQGFISIKSVQSLNLSMGYIMKRSKLNPGTHLYTSGINEKAGPANEYECELIMWKIIPGLQTTTINWTSHVWRRGTIPLWWKFYLKNQNPTISTTNSNTISSSFFQELLTSIETTTKQLKGNEIELLIRDKENPYEKSEHYYTNLLNRYSGFSEQNKKQIPTIHLVNLLKQENDKQEQGLSYHFNNSCKRVMSLLNCNLDMIQFDWYSNLKNNNGSLEKNVQNLWESLREVNEKTSFSKGSIKVVVEENNSNSNLTMSFSPLQYSSNFNYNNTSSNNLMNQFSTFSVYNNNNNSKNSLQDSTGSLGSSGGGNDGVSNSSGGILENPSVSGTANSTTTAFSSPGQLSLSSSQYLSTSPNSTKKLIFTSYQPQKEIARYSCLDSLERVNTVVYFNLFQIVVSMGIDLGVGFSELFGFSQVTLDFMASTLKRLGLFGPLTEFFLTSNDISSILYQNTPSQQAPIMRDYSTGVTASVTGQLLSAQRKYQGNNNNDEIRNHHYLQFLGSSGPKFFPFNSSVGKEILPYWISSPPTACVMALPSLLANSPLNSSILIQDIDDFCWILPEGAKTCEVVIYLGQPSIVTELCLTISHGTNNDSYPQTMNISLGNYFNETNLILQDINIPRCTTGTKLSYVLPKLSWEAYSNISNNFDNILKVLESNGDQKDQSDILSVFTPPTSLSPVLEPNSPSPSSPKFYDPDSLKKISDSQDDENEILLISDYNGERSTLDSGSIDPQNSETMLLSLSSNDDSPIKKYESLVKRLVNLNKEGKTITFLESLELECKRTQLRVSPFERDKVFRSLGIQSNLLNPERFLFERDEKIEVNIRKNHKYKQSICQRPQCGKLFYLDKIRLKQCSYCYKRFCPSCMSSNQMKIFEFKSPKPISVCNTCASLISKQEILFQKLNNHTRSLHLERSKINLNFYQNILLDFKHNQNNININSNNQSTLPHSFESLSNTLIPLSEYPKAGFLNSIKSTDPKSPPIETILLPPGILPLNMFWYAPPTVNSVELVIMLSYESLVYSISLITDSLGYHNYDLPNVNIKIGKTFTLPDHFENQGDWVFHPNVWSTSDPNLIIQPQSCISYILPQPIQARAISLKFSLPDLPTFLTYETNQRVKPFLHIGRIAVHGIYSDSLSDIPTWTSSLIPLHPDDKDLYENTLYTNSQFTTKRNPIKVNSQQKLNNSIHITLTTGTSVKGFGLIMLHDDTEGVKSQIKSISVSCVIVNQKNEFQSHQYTE